MEYDEYHKLEKYIKENSQAIWDVCFVDTNASDWEES